MLTLTISTQSIGRRTTMRSTIFLPLLVVTITILLYTAESWGFQHQQPKQQHQPGPRPTGLVFQSRTNYDPASAIGGSLTTTTRRTTTTNTPSRPEWRRHDTAWLFTLVKATPNGGSTDATVSSTPAPLDFGAIGRYILAFVIQMSILTLVLTGVDRTVSVLNGAGVRLPFIVNFIFFYCFALKSRFANPLSNERPKPSTKEIDNDDAVVEAQAPRKMPEWTPPGVIFPIVWLLIIGPLRAVSSSLLVSKLLLLDVGVPAYASTPILALMAHLSIGDIWNTINNKERRYGTSVLGVCLVWISAAVAASKYYQVMPLAGKLLSIPLVWLTIASSLIFRTWQLNNPNPVTGRPYSILPRLEQEEPVGKQTKTITKLIWFEK
jgi:translocator protein